MTVVATMPMGPRRDEIAAQQIVERVLQVNLQHHDQYGSVDFVFRHGDKSAALEVTRYTDREERKNHEAWRRYADQAYVASSLSRSWIVTTDGATQFKVLKKQLEIALLELEQRGITEYDSEDAEIYPLAGWLSPEASALLQSNRVNHAVVAERSGEPTVLLLHATRKSAHGPGLAAVAVESFIAETPDNLQKLARSGAVERHLWVWVDAHTQAQAELPLLRDDLPDYPIALPPEVTHLWMCHENRLPGWRFSTEEGWRLTGEPWGAPKRLYGTA